MNGTRKIGPIIKPNDYLIHPIFLARFQNSSNKNKQPIIPEIKDNKMVFFKKSEDNTEIKNLAEFMEKPYTSINSNLILQLKKINNLIDIENKLKNKEFKTDSEFRYYFNLFIRKNLKKMSLVQYNILLSFLLDYFKSNYNIEKKKLEIIVNKWKDKDLENNFYYNFIEYIEKKI